MHLPIHDSKKAACPVLDYKRGLYSGSIWLLEREIVSFPIVIFVSRLGPQEKQRLDN